MERVYERFPQTMLASKRHVPSKNGRTDVTCVPYWRGPTAALSAVTTTHATNTGSDFMVDIISAMPEMTLDVPARGDSSRV